MSWRGRRVLVTGHTGFKGAWLSLWLDALGAEVWGASLPPVTGGAFELAQPVTPTRSRILDIRDLEPLANLFADVQPEVVFHLAAQALVRRGWGEPVETYATNVMGTVNLLAAASSSRCASPPVVVVVTSDKVYANPELGPRREGDPLGGTGPYETSKACAELVVQGWPGRLRVATARAGNVLGGGDVAPDRIVPDALGALDRGEPVRLRHPDAVRPWQHVLDPLSGYVKMAEALIAAVDIPPALNFGPSPQGTTVAELVDMIIDEWGEGSWEAAGRQVDDAPETGHLSLDSTLARDTLAWEPRATARHAVRAAVGWHKAARSGEDMRNFALAELDRWGNP